MKQASPSDVPQLVAMMDEFYRESGYRLNQQHASKAFATLLTDERLGYVWFIQSNEQNVGYVAVSVGYSLEYGGRSAFLDDLFVRLPFRRMGLATAALKEVRDFCIGRGVRSIHVETGAENAAAQAVYRRIGFAITDRQLLTLRLANPIQEE